MSLMAKIEEDLRSSMLSGDKKRVSTLKMMKTSLQYYRLSLSPMPEQLSDEQFTSRVQKEIKTRKDSADLYKSAGHDDRSDAELEEIQVLSEYLPTQLEDSELKSLIQDILDNDFSGSFDQKDTGKIISMVVTKIGNKTDGATISRILKEMNK
jgi:uncharacterized protein